MSKPRKAILYTRVSSDAQEDGTSLVVQFLSCQKKAEEIGAQAVAHMEEVESGGLYLARPKMQEALRLIEAGEADTLIIYRLDRTGRDVDALRDIRRRVAVAGGQLVYADGMQFDKTPIGNLMFTQLGAFAEFEREMIRERTVSGARRRAAGGTMPTRTFRPFGYKFVDKKDVEAGTHSKEDIGKYYIIEEEAHWVRRLFTEYASGASLSELSRLLRDNNVPTMRGSSHWAVPTLGDLLSNPIYKGRAAYGKTQNLTDESRLLQGWNAGYRRMRDESEWIYFDAPALVDETTWDACQGRMQENRTVKAGRKETHRLLSGLVRCRVCGYAKSFQVRRYRYQRTTDRYYKPRPRAIGHYRCPRTVKPDRCEESRTGGDALKLHTAVAEVVKQIVADPGMLRTAFEQYLVRRSNDASGSKKSELTRLQAEVRKLETKRGALIDAEIEALSAGRAATPYRARLTQLEAEMEQATARLAALQVAAEQVAAVKQSADPWKTAARSIVQMLETESIPEYDKNRVLQNFIHHVFSDVDVNAVDVYFNEHTPGFCYHARLSKGVCKVALMTAAEMLSTSPVRRRGRVQMVD